MSLAQKKTWKSIKVSANGKRRSKRASFSRSKATSAIKCRKVRNYKVPRKIKCLIKCDRVCDPQGLPDPFRFIIESVNCKPIKNNCKPSEDPRRLPDRAGKDRNQGNKLEPDRALFVFNIFSLFFYPEELYHNPKR